MERERKEKEVKREVCNETPSIASLKCIESMSTHFGKILVRKPRSSRAVTVSALNPSPQEAKAGG